MYKVPFRQIQTFGRPKVDWILNPYGWGSYNENIGKHRNYTQQNTPSVSSTIIKTEHGVGLSVPGTGGQSQRYDAPYFHRVSGGDWYDALTIGAWIKCTDTTDDHAVCGVYAGVGAPEDTSFLIDLDVWDGNLYPKIHVISQDNTLLQSTTDAAAVTAGFIPISDGFFHHIIFQIFLDGDNLLNIKMWTDGILQDDVRHTSTGWNNDSANTTTNLLEIFERGGGDPEAFNGEIVGLFMDRTRWSDDRIARSYIDHWSELFEPVRVMRRPATSTVVITDVSGDDAWQDGDTGIIANGTGFM